MVSGGSGSADPGSGGVPRACDNMDSEGTSASGGAEEVEMTRTLKAGPSAPLGLI